ncbi:MAG: hypothetical protein WBQ23_13350 [Bacteroidota bacterium]
MRTLPFAVLLMLFILIAQQPAAAQSPFPAILAAQSSHISLPQLKTALAKDGRGISEATYDELDRLLPSSGGALANLNNPEFVLRIGTSTFILDMRILGAVILLAMLVTLLLFSPIGFVLFRGGVHALLGNLLLMTHIAPDYGRHLVEEPRKWLRREATARLAFRGYMKSSFLPEYRNGITGTAFLGTAFLIFTIGLRGIKFMVPHQPDLIIIAIIVEITVLCMLGFSTIYERTDDEAPAAMPENEAIMLPNGEYISREYVLDALQTVLSDLSVAAANDAHK